MSSDTTEVDPFYGKAKTYWAEIPATVDGMLGGYSSISSLDINDSLEFIGELLQVRCSMAEPIVNIFKQAFSGPNPNVGGRKRWDVRPSVSVIAFLHGLELFNGRP